MRHQKSGSKRNPSGAHPFTVPLPYHQPSIPPVFHTMVPPPHIAVPGYAYPPGPGRFPTVETHLVKSGCETPPQALPPGHGVDASRNVQPPPRVDPNAYVVNFSNRRPNMQEPGGHLNHPWHHQRAFSPRDNIPMQQGIGPRAFGGPPFFGPAPGFMVGSSFYGPASICYVPVAPGSIRGPHPPRFIPYPFNPGPPVVSTETAALRTNIVKQIDYYFSDENLQNDHYLISLMDDQGWVPVSIIADFKRVKKMSTDIPFILDALQTSSTVEVQADKIRKRDNWLKWISSSKEISLSLQAQTPQGQSIEKVIDSFANGDANKKNVGNISEENVEFPHNGSLVEHLLPNRDTPVVPHISDTEHDNMSANFNGGTQALGCGKLKFSGCGPSPLCPDHSQREEHAEFSVDGTESREMLSDMAVQNVGDLSNDFANTFMLDEEIELEQKTIKNNDLSSARSQSSHCRTVLHDTSCCLYETWLNHGGICIVCPWFFPMMRFFLRCSWVHGVWNLALLCLMWSVWQERNRRIFEDLEKSLNHLKEQFSGLLYDCSRTWGFTEASSLPDFIASLNTV
uniref:HTH La-type RNA-binding domain-containing protein n=1 Tax=Fagus sylvatica TaxID=28930 RepID=A0A2N9GQG7_FAGSY